LIRYIIYEYKLIAVLLVYFINISPTTTTTTTTMNECILSTSISIYLAIITYHFITTITKLS